jgi:Mg/Co/Ni transporter MgtE
MREVFSRLGVFKELLSFLWMRRLWWLIPMIIALVIVGLFIAGSASGVLSPFLYSLF